MNSLYHNGRKLQQLCTISLNSTKMFILCCNRLILFGLNPFFIHVFYFLCLSFMGFGSLKSLNLRSPNFTPRNIDFFFMSVSAATVSSMSTVEMEVFSNSQLLVMTVLMFLGGEVFTSMVGLHLKTSKIINDRKTNGKVESVKSDRSISSSSLDKIEMGMVTGPGLGQPRFGPRPEILSCEEDPFIKYNSIKFLGFVVLGYLLVSHILGIFFLLVYVTLVQSAQCVLREKGLNLITFAVFTIVSTFASCGFVPTNENMMVFRKNSGLLLILIPQVLLGNTLFPWGLRLSVWAIGKLFKKAEARYLLRNTNEAGYTHFLPRPHCVHLVGTVLVFILIGSSMFCTMEWGSAGLRGLDSYQKVVGAIFESVNARHSGETIVDLSTVAPAILALFVVMMYLPPYTSFVPIKRDEGKCEIKKRSSSTLGENIVFSQLSYLSIFVIIICITERKSIKEDPINFSVLNIIVEVISAYGNVGFTTGYNCEYQIRPYPNCVNKWYGFSGKWSDKGKLVLIVVMLFGRLKKFNVNGGRAWILL